MKKSKLIELLCISSIAFFGCKSTIIDEAYSDEIYSSSEYQVYENDVIAFLNSTEVNFKDSVQKKTYWINNKRLFRFTF